MADEQLDKLVVQLEARLTQFQKSMDKAIAQADGSAKKVQNRFDKLAASLDSRFKSMGRGAFDGIVRGAVPAIGAVLSVSAAVEGTKSALDAFGDIADKSTAAGLDSEFFQGIAYQAKHAGVEIDTVASATAAFAKNSALAEAGQGRMVTQLKALDPVLLENIRNAATQEDRIRAVADALEHQTDAAKRAAIATAAFGQSGPQFAAVFAGGADALDAMNVKAKELGLIVDRDLIARADALGDEFDTTTQIVDLQLKQALVNLGPILVWLSGLAGDVASQIGHTVDGLKDLKDQSSSTLEGRLKGIDIQQQALNPSAVPLTADAADAARAPILAELKRRALDQLKAELSNRPPAGAALPPIQSDADKKHAQELEQQQKKIDAVTKSLKLEEDNLGATNRQQFINNQLAAAGTTAATAQGKAITELAGHVFDAKEAFEASDQAASFFAQTTESAFEGIVDGSSSVVDALGQVAKAILNAVIQAELLGSGPLASILGTAPTGGASTGGLFGSLFSTIFGGGKAAGGPVSAGTAFMVGEKGPELFVPKVPGTIVSNGALRGGGSVVNVSIDARGAELGVEEKIVRAIKRVVPQMIDSQAPVATFQRQRDRRRA